MSASSARARSSASSTPPRSNPIVEVVANTTDGKGAQTIAVGGDASEPVVYVGEAGGLRVLRPGSAHLDGRLVTSTPAGSRSRGTVGAMFFDLAPTSSTSARRTAWSPRTRASTP